MKYEEQFTAFIDFLGVTEASIRSDKSARTEILNLLVSLSTLRGEFDLRSTAEGTSKTIHVRPAVSTFSDHIVISYRLDPMRIDSGANETVVALTILHHFGNLLTRLVAAALNLGFLIRGGAAIGKLHHENGVVFGEALIDAVNIESRTAVYPRVVFSSTVTGNPSWIKPNGLFVARDDDGLYYANCFTTLFNAAVPPGEFYKASVGKWFDSAVAVIAKNLAELEKEGRLNQLAKWTWFARKFRAALDRMPDPLKEALGLSPAKISWQ